MAEFADEDEIDLGELKKWKYSTLKDLQLLCPSPIEAEYRRHIENYDKRIETVKSFNIGFHCKLVEVYWRVKELDDLLTNRNKLVEDFKKYYEIFPGRINKNHPHWHGR